MVKPEIEPRQSNSGPVLLTLCNAQNQGWGQRGSGEGRQGNVVRALEGKGILMEGMPSALLLEGLWRDLTQEGGTGCGGSKSNPFPLLSALSAPPCPPPFASPFPPTSFAPSTRINNLPSEKNTESPDWGQPDDLCLQDRWT